MSARAGRRPFRAKSVTHVSGINRYLCNRNTPKEGGGEIGIRTLDTVPRILDFESSAFDHSAISPRTRNYTGFGRSLMENKNGGPRAAVFSTIEPSATSSPSPLPRQVPSRAASVEREVCPQ